ncbi:MAG TPA: hypothetical protein VF756_17535 [Thermoanaerobaculia bacterium]
MLQFLTPSSFSEHLGTTFRIYSGGEPLEAVLYEVKRHEEHDGPRKQPFSIFFRTSSRGPVLPQSIYQVEHDHLGTMEIFLVPVGPDAQGMRYEAVFN